MRKITLQGAEMSMRAFTARIQESGGGGAYVFVPFDVEKEYGLKLVPIRATIDGEPYRGTLVRMGTPQHMLIVRKDVRQRIGKEPGDEVSVTLELDTEERTIDVPGDLQEALGANAAAAAFFDTLSFTHRREYVQWIEEAKKAETRARRIARTLEMLLAQKRGR